MNALPRHEAAREQPARAIGATAEAWVEVLGSRHFPAWLAEQQPEPVVHHLPDWQVVLYRPAGPTGELSVFERTFNRAMGLWSNGPTLWMSSQYQLWRFENRAADGESTRGI